MWQCPPRTLGRGCCDPIWEWMDQGAGPSAETPQDFRVGQRKSPKLLP